MKKIITIIFALICKISVILSYFPSNFGITIYSNVFLLLWVPALKILLSSILDLIISKSFGKSVCISSHVTISMFPFPIIVTK